MNPVTEQRMLLEQERQGIIQNPGLAILGGCERHPQQEEESVFMTPNNTPKSSPTYSTDGNAYTSEMGYFASSPTSIGHVEPLQSLPPPASSSGFMGPASPCNEFCGSPYSPPYDNQSPHSLACSTPHGSPTSMCSDNGQYMPYHLSPSNSIHDIPNSTMAMSSEMSLPYSVDNSSLIYTTVPTTAASYYSNVTQAPWMDGNTLPSFEAFQQGVEPSQLHNATAYNGAIPVTVIDMQMTRGGTNIDPEMNTPLNFYSPSASPDRDHPVFYDMPAMEMAPGATFPTYPIATNKPAKTPRKPKAKPVVQVNDEHIKDIPTSAQLWEFTLHVLKKPAYNYMINWENRKEGLFRFHDAPAFAALWGKHRNRPNMTYDKVARALRYYYKRDILNQVGGRLTYRFSKRLGKLYSADD